MKIIKKLAKIINFEVISYIIVLCVLVYSFGYAFGKRNGRREMDNYRTDNRHRQMELDGLQYCPYCGTNLEEILKEY